MRDRAEECRQKALGWEHAATVPTDRTSQEIYLELARQWRDMADYFDEIEHGLAARLPVSKSRQCC
jgi:hypothetical protein